MTITRQFCDICRCESAPDQLAPATISLDTYSQNPLSELNDMLKEVGAKKAGCQDATVALPEVCRGCQTALAVAVVNKIEELRAD